MVKKLILIDGNSIAYRAFYALPMLNNTIGIHTNAVYGFAMMLNKILEEEKPTHIAVAFDAGKTTFRHAFYEDYKGGRQKTPPELSEQFPYIRKLLDAFGIYQYEMDQYEADDIIGTLAKEAEEKGFTVRIVSGDRDLTQLASEKTTVCVTKKGVTELEIYTPEHIMEKYGLTPSLIVDLKGLAGDNSDNIPGVPGIGEKTAIKLLKQYGSLERVLEAAGEIPQKKLKENLQTFKEQALLSKRLAKIERNAPIAISVETIAYRGEDRKKLMDLYRELEFHSFLEKMDVPEKTALEPLDFTFCETVTEEMVEEGGALYVEMIEENYHLAPILGFGLKNRNGTYYIPTETALHSDLFIDFLEDENRKKAVYDGKRSIIALRRRGVELRGIEFDLLIAAYLLDPSETITDFSDAVKTQNYPVLSDDQVYGKGAKRSELTDRDRAEHVARKAKAIWDLKEPYLNRLRKNDQLDLFVRLEMPLSRILADMETWGIKVDRKRLEAMGREIQDQMARMEDRIYELAGEKFNINSTKQLGTILFDKLGLKPIKKTKTGYSTNADVLEKLRFEHEIVEQILGYRQLMKLHSTYIEGLLKVIHQDTGKVHTRFNQALTQTGRLSSTDPNLQNIPIRIEEGRKIRQAFVPSEEGWVIFSADYSQIELRVLAHISGDERLMDAFWHDMDIHTKTAMDVFHVEKDEVTPAMRRQAKAVNFGIVYGISDYGLSQNLGIPRKEAARFIERYFESYPKVKEYMEWIVQEAKLKGYVTTLLNRRRYIPEITSRNYNVRSFAERTAMNTPIQGSAADIIKKAMIDVAKRMKEEKLRSRLLLQVHDELIFEVPREEIELMKEIVPECMENAIRLNVPLKVDYAFGPTWYDAK